MAHASFCGELQVDVPAPGLMPGPDCLAEADRAKPGTGANDARAPRDL